MNPFRIFLFLKLLLLCFFFTNAYPYSGEEIYNLIKSGHQRIFPKQFRATVDSLLVTKQLETIPRDKVIFGKRPYVQLLFKEKLPLKLKVKNVESYYKDFFEVYEAILIRSGFFFGVNQFYTAASFLKAYRLVWDAAQKRVQIFEREELPGDYGFFYVDESFKIIRSEFFENNKKIGEIKFVHKKIKEFVVIDTLSIWFLEEGTHKKITFDVKLSRFDFSFFSSVLFD